MFNRKFTKFTSTIFFLLLLSSGVNLGWFESVQAASLDGRILLQVQDKGQAWYVNPLDGRRYYLGRPDDAFAVMRQLGLGISNKDLAEFLKAAPARLAGRILLKVQDKGQAYYVDPLNLKLYYLGRPADAFALMRAKGLGITNSNLATIPIATSGATVSPPITPAVISTGSEVQVDYSFKYQNKNYNLTLPLSSTLYNSYKNSAKVYTYLAGNEPANLREVFYGLFLNIKNGDHSLDDLVTRLKEIANANNFSDDQLIEFSLAFIQYIPYDEGKVTANTGVNNNPFFPYETLYLDKGVCSDKTFLAVNLMRKLGYGAAILDFPERNHTALGIACPVEYSINNSGYCYGETTNFFPLGVIPQNINNGQAQTASVFDGLFDPANLGKIEIYQASQGKVYQGMPAVQNKVAELKALKEEIAAREEVVNNLALNLSTAEAQIKHNKELMDAYYRQGQIKEYNDLVIIYNNQVNQYNADLAVYQKAIEDYNLKVNAFNSAYRYFYQQNG